MSKQDGSCRCADVRLHACSQQCKPCLALLVRLSAAHMHCAGAHLQQLILHTQWDPLLLIFTPLHPLFWLSLLLVILVVFMSISIGIIFVILVTCLQTGLQGLPRHSQSINQSFQLIHISCLQDSSGDVTCSFHDGSCCTAYAVNACMLAWPWVL